MFSQTLYSKQQNANGFEKAGEKSIYINANDKKKLIVEEERREKEHYTINRKNRTKQKPLVKSSKEQNLNST